MIREYSRLGVEVAPLSEEQVVLVRSEQSGPVCYLCSNKLPDNRRKRCQSCNTKIRRIRTKLAAIKYLGGCCAECGFNKHPAALEFHHVNQDKEFTIGAVSNKSWEVIKKELDKCMLLCSNCHRARHSNRTEPKWLEEAEKYQGKILN